MTHDESVALDALRALGLHHITPWHLRCLESYVAVPATTVNEDCLLTELAFNNFDDYREWLERSWLTGFRLRGCHHRWVNYKAMAWPGIAAWLTKNANVPTSYVVATATHCALCGAEP